MKSCKTADGLRYLIIFRVRVTVWTESTYLYMFIKITLILQGLQANFQLWNEENTVGDICLHIEVVAQYGGEIDRAWRGVKWGEYEVLPASYNTFGSQCFWDIDWSTCKAVLAHWHILLQYCQHAASLKIFLTAIKITIKKTIIA